MTSMLKDTIDYVALVMMIFNIFIFIPILIYYLILYRQYEKQVIDKNKTATNVIHQRNSFLVYTINILAIFTNCTERVYMVSSEIWGIIHVPFWSVSLFLAITWWALMDLFAIKVFHLYYRQQLNQSIADRSWKKHINPHIDDWYILNRNKYGNPFYLIKLIFIPYLISVVIDAGLFAFLFGGLLLDFSHLTLATIPTVIAMYVFWKARKLNDIYSIRNEILYQFVIVLSTLSIYMVIFMICGWIIVKEHDGVYDRHSDNVHRFEWMTYIFITDAVTFSLALFSTLYPVYLTKKKEREIGSDLLKKQLNKDRPTVRGIQGINSIIRHYVSFKSFMEYLVSEFCPENVLFLVELIQIKYAFQQRKNNLVRIPKQSVVVVADYIGGIDKHSLESKRSSSSMQKQDNKLFQVIDFNVHPNNTDTNDCIYTYLFNDDGSIMTQITLTSQIPSSSILSVAPNNLYLQMKMLHEKYVKIGCEYELNIPYSIRNSLTHYFNNNIEDKEYKLFNIMDACCIEIVKLLCYSFDRFSCTKEYKAVIGDIDTLEALDDIALSNMLNRELPVIRNATSYNMMKNNLEPQIC